MNSDCIELTLRSKLNHENNDLAIGTDCDYAYHPPRAWRGEQDSPHWWVRFQFRCDDICRGRKEEKGTTLTAFKPFCVQNRKKPKRKQCGPNNVPSKQQLTTIFEKIIQPINAWTVLCKLFFL